MNSRKTLAICMAVSLILGSCKIFAQTAEELLPKGIQLEEVKGELKKAIEVYQTIVTKFSTNRPIAAKAQLHIGFCYEKLGLKEAEKSYQRVIENYPDQTEAVETAKEKLSILLRAKAVIPKSEAEYKLSKIYSGLSHPCSVSPDGKKLALLKSEDWDIYLMDIVTKEEVRLTNESNSITDIGWSQDSRKIAFSDMVGNLYVVPTKGGPPKMIIKADPEAVKTKDKIEISGWTSDSKKIIFQVPSKGLFAISSSGGEWEEIMTFQDPKKARKYGAMSLSPNGQFIACDFTQNGNTDIYVSRMDREESVRITKNPAYDNNTQWSFDGQWLCFNSNRTNRPEAWVIKITPDGKPDGMPFQVSKGGVLYGNWAQDGKAGYCIAVRTEHVYIANQDGTDEFQLTKFPAFNKVPRWSPDGKMIAFASDYDQSLNTFRIWTVPSKGGEAKLIADAGWEYVWFPDGEMITYKILQNNSIILKRPGEGETLKELVVDVEGEIDNLDWSPDGEKIVFSTRISPNFSNYSNISEYLKNIVTGISIIPATGGKPTELIPAEKKGLGNGSPRWSPDGKKIVFGTITGMHLDKVDVGLWTIDAEGGELKLITKSDRDGYKLCWTPDGKYIIGDQRIKGMEFELMKVPAEGGTLEKMNILGRSPACSPDGKKIAYSRRLEGYYEFWLVENFLPGVDTEK